MLLCRDHEKTFSPPSLIAKKGETVSPFPHLRREKEEKKTQSSIGGEKQTERKARAQRGRAEKGGRPLVHASPRKKRA